MVRVSKCTGLGFDFHNKLQGLFALKFLCHYITVVLSHYCVFYTFVSFYFVPVLVLHRSGFASNFPTTNKFISWVGAAFTCLETAFRLDALHRQMKLLGEDNPVSKLQVKLEPGIAFG